LLISHYFIGALQLWTNKQ